jgi:putative DNA methylase
MSTRPEVLIEKWFPVDIIGAESMRERGASSALPPLYFLHVWWARRPLTASRAAILASVLPTWKADWPDTLRKQFPTEEVYQQWFLRLCGIFGDPVKGRKLIQWAKDKGIKLKTSPYTHKRAFTVSPSSEYLKTLGDLLEHTWGTRTLSVLDSFAGGGSIPFEARRYGFNTYANELNPVASIILKATLDYPFRFGASLTDDIRKYGRILADRVKKRLESFFPVEQGESIHAYIWARTVICPYTGKPIPLSPNWWLQKGATQVAVRPIFDASEAAARFEILTGAAAVHCQPDRGTVKRGNAISPWDNNQPVDGDYIKTEAEAGRMGQQLYALAVKRSTGLTFRPPTATDMDAVQSAEAEYERKRGLWEAKDILPNEVIPYGHRSHERDGIVRYGVTTMRDFFAPRQLLAHGTWAEELLNLRPELLREVGPERFEALMTYLAVLADKAVDYNSRFMKWDGTRNKLCNTFDRHDFSFKWSHGEFDAAHNLFPWLLEQVSDAYAGLAKLAEPIDEIALHRDLGQLVLSKGNAGSLKEPATGSVHNICVDPPYYNNVNYSELSDFFLVWLRRNLRSLHLDILDEDLANRDDEAVANPARFHGVEKSPKARMVLASADYERKMAAGFREMHRVLHDQGSLTVMFTHKQVAAWDTLAMSLIGAGFTIRSSWPVHTESEHSTHVAKKNAAQSTILLTCRKREPSPEAVWWEDIKGRVQQVARETAIFLEKRGIRGVDLYIATFGPTLAILSENWPVLTAEVDDKGNPKPLRPEVALDLARAEVLTLRKQNLLLGRAVQFDKATDWYLMAWDAFSAAEFPADEARKLALALDLDLEKDVVAARRLVTKKQSTVVMQEPKARRKRDMVDPDKTTFDCWIDAAHTAMVLYAEDGAQACQQFLRRANLIEETTFKALLQSLINAIPRTRLKGKFVRPEAEILENMRLAFFDELTVPVEEEVLPPEPKDPLFAWGGIEEPAEDEDENDDEDSEDE